MPSILAHNTIGGFKHDVVLKHNIMVFQRHCSNISNQTIHLVPESQ